MLFEGGTGRAASAPVRELALFHRRAITRIAPTDALRVSPSPSSSPIEGEGLYLRGACRGPKALCVLYSSPEIGGLRGLKSLMETLATKFAPPYQL